MSSPHSGARKELLRLLADKSFRLGEFKLSSGATSDYYIDCRTTTLDAKGSRLTGEVFVEEIRKRGWKPHAIGGLTMGADPIVVAVSVVSGELHGFLVRKAEKQHGTGQRIEGFREKGARVVIVDDVCTTGASTVEAIAAAREFGFEVVGVLCLVEREEAGGQRTADRSERVNRIGRAKAFGHGSYVVGFTKIGARAGNLQRQRKRGAERDGQPETRGAQMASPTHRPCRPGSKDRHGKPSSFRRPAR